MPARLLNNEENIVLRKSYSKSFVWEQFERGAEKTACKHCKCEYKIKYGSTSDLLHLKSKHSDIFAIINAKKVSKSTYSVSYLDTNSQRSKDLTNAIARMIALDLQLYSIVNDVGFRSLLNISEPKYLAVQHFQGK